MADIQQDTINAITTMRAEAMQAYERLETIASLPYLSWFDFSALEGFSPAEPTLIESKGLPSLEKVPTPNLTGISAETYERYRAHVWQGTNLDELQAKAMEWINSGGVGISQDVQDAIFNQGRERDLQTLRDELDLAGARTGARGFRYANSMTRTLQNQALERYSYKKTDLSREIVKTIADLAQKNVQFAFQEDVAIEGLHADFAIKFADLLRNINRDTLDRFKIEQDARIVEFEGELKRFGLGVEIDLKNATLSADHQSRLLETWKTHVGILTDRGKAQILQSEEASRVKLTAAEKLADVYSTTIQNLTGSAISVVTSKK